MRGQEDAKGLCSGPCPSCDRERYLALLRSRAVQSDMGKQARSILAQYNAHQGHSPKFGQRFWGPHYVTYDRGEFYLWPYGLAARWRYSFHCRPEFIPGEVEPLWTFMVLP